MARSVTVRDRGWCDGPSPVGDSDSTGTISATRGVTASDASMPQTDRSDMIAAASVELAQQDAASGVSATEQQEDVMA